MGELSTLGLVFAVVATFVLMGLYLAPTRLFCMLIGALTAVGGILLISYSVPLAICTVLAGIILVIYGIRLHLGEARHQPEESEIAPGLRSSFRVPYDDE